MNKKGTQQQNQSQSQNKTGNQKSIVAYTLESLNAPPLDFSYKNIKELNEIKHLEPRQVLHSVKQGKSYVMEQKSAPRKPLIVQNEIKDDNKNSLDEKDSKQINQQVSLNQNAVEKNDQVEEQQKIPDILRCIPNNNVISQVPMYQSINKQSQTHAKQGDENGQNMNKKVVKIKQIQSQVILSYNKIQSVANLLPVLDSVMFDCSQIQWIDLSHNYLVNLDYDFSQIVNLKSLYLHCNYIRDLNQIINLTQNKLKALTIHGNPIENIPNFRLYIISLLLSLQRLDTVLITKKERDDSEVFLVKFNLKSRPLPEVKDAQEPPKEEEVEQKN